MEKANDLSCSIISRAVHVIRLKTFEKETEISSKL